MKYDATRRRDLATESRSWFKRINGWDGMVFMLNSIVEANGCGTCRTFAFKRYAVNCQAIVPREAMIVTRKARRPKILAVLLTVWNRSGEYVARSYTDASGEDAYDALTAAGYKGLQAPCRSPAS